MASYFQKPIFIVFFIWKLEYVGLFNILKIHIIIFRKMRFFVLVYSKMISVLGGT